jgi:protein TonB
MQSKKSFKEELKSKQKSFLLIGMFVALGMSLMAFEWASFKLEHIKVDELVIDDFNLEPAVEIIQIEMPKPKYIAKVKEREFDPNKDLEFKKVDVIDSTIVKNTKVIIDPKIGDDDIKIIEIGNDIVKIEPIHDVADVNPEFPGGLEEMYKYLGKTIKYPEIERQIGTQGKVYLRFVVEKDGSITDLEVIRSLSDGCDKVALSAVKNMPNWKPGMIKGKEVRVKFTLPVFFKLK